MKILFVGDCVGKAGRETLKHFLETEKEKLNISLVIANLENASHGKGLLEKHFLDMVASGIDVVTMGNHYLAKKEILNYIDNYPTLLRPRNLPKYHPGRGDIVINKNHKNIKITNLMGRVFMADYVTNPFESLEESVSLNPSENVDIHIVDLHAEATGEKQALAWEFDGKITALIGTHTHVQTNDARLLKNGTFYLSDVGMVGPYNGILGSSRDAVIKRNMTGLPAVFDVQDDDTFILNAVILDIDDKTNKVIDFQLINKLYSKDEVDV